jgi:hypothetical protein
MFTPSALMMSGIGDQMWYNEEARAGEDFNRGQWTRLDLSFLRPGDCAWFSFLLQSGLRRVRRFTVPGGVQSTLCHCASNRFHEIWGDPPTRRIHITNDFFNEVCIVDCKHLGFEWVAAEGLRTEEVASRVFGNGATMWETNSHWLRATAGGSRAQIMGESISIVGMLTPVALDHFRNCHEEEVDEDDIGMIVTAETRERRRRRFMADHYTLW